MDVVSPTAATIYAPTEDDELPIPAAKTEIRDVQRVETQNVSAPTSIASSTGQPGALFPDDELHHFRACSDQVQTSFVDEPRQAMEQADSLVARY